RATPLRVPRTERRRHERLDQPGLAARGRAERAQVARCHPEAGELGASGRDISIPLGVQTFAGLVATVKQSELVELLGQLVRYPGALAELGEVDLALMFGERGRPAPFPLALRGRRELLPDHAQRQELVSLETQDRLEALDVLL